MANNSAVQAPTAEQQSLAVKSPPANGERQSNGFSARMHTTNGNSNGVTQNGFGSQGGSPVDGYYANGSALRVPKSNILRERTARTSMMVKTRLGSMSTVVFESSPTFDDFLDALTSERLRRMPHDGSKWDKVLKWAEGFTEHVFLFHQAVHSFMDQSEEATRLVWGSCLSLLQMGPSQINVLTKAFSVFHQLGLTIFSLLRQQSLLTATAEIRRELSHAFSDLMELTCAVNAHYRSKSSGMIDASDFDECFGELVAGFYSHKDRAINAMWAREIDNMDTFGERDVRFDKMRLFLSPQDRMVRKAISQRQSFSYSRAEFTCEWFGTALSKFMINRKKILLVTGPPDSGKTVLSGWIIETLQGSLEHNSYDVLYYHVDRNMPSMCSSMSVVKGLLLQAIDRYIGSTGLIRKVQEAMDLVTKGSSEAEQKLWEALHAIIGHSKTMVVVDGIDHVVGEHKPHASLLDRLESLTSYKERSTVKVVALSRPLQKAAPPMTQHCSIEEKSIEEDIHRFISSTLRTHRHYDELQEDDRNRIADIMCERSRGSFLWAELALATVKSQHTVTAMVETVERMPKSTEDLFDHILTSLGKKKIEPTSLLAWLLASERPLSVIEIKALLEIDPMTCKHVPRHNRIEEEIRHMCGSLIVIRDGLVYLRHPSLRHHIYSSKSGHINFSRADAHQQLTLRCLTYVKARLHSDVRPTMERINSREMISMFEKYDLLEYTARYWTIHFHSSPLYASDGNHKLSEQFKTCMPTSTLLAQIEGTCLGYQYSLKQANTFQLIAYQTRKSVFGEHSQSVLQSLVHLVRLCMHLRTTKTLDYSYEAWKISKFCGFHDLTISCAETYIECTQVIKIEDRSKLVKRKEEVLVSIVETYKHKYGASHDLTLKYTRTLAEFYIETHQTERAVTLYREIYEASVEKYGYFHKETTKIYDLLIQKLQVLSRSDVIAQIVRSYHDYVVRNLSVTDERRWKSTQTMCKIYEERHEYFKAEEVILTHWRSVASEKSMEITETKTHVALEYSRFLCRHQRKEEAEVIMRGVWSEMETSKEERKTETYMKSCKMIAEEFRSLKVFSVARSIYSSLVSQFTRTEEKTSAEVIQIASSLAETITESISSTTTTTVLTKEEEHTLRAVFQATLESSSKTVSSSTIKTCKALATSYIKQERWSEAVSVYSQTLSQVWSSIETTEETRDLTIEQHSGTIETAMNLAQCRFEMCQVEKAQFIYNNVFRSLIRMSRCDAHTFTREVRKIIEFHEKTYRFDKAIEVYKESFVYLQNKLGRSHPTTIEILRSYGSLSKRLQKSEEAQQAYHHIYMAYRDDSGCLRAEGLDDALILCELYERNEKWEAAKSVYACLWETFLKRGKEYRLDFCFVEKVYNRYMHILEHKTKTDYTVVRKLAVDYRATCVSFYGHSSELTIKATMALAQISERNEQYQEESISLYEEALKQTSVTSTTTSVLQVKKRLAKMYSSKSATVSKAVSLYSEQLESSRQEYGYSSTETLSVLQDLVMTYKKQETKETTTKAVQTLRTAVTECFRSETRSEKIIESAKLIAQTYVECGYKQQAVTIIQELRQQVIQDVRSGKKISNESTSYVFLASFSEIVTQSGFSSFMAELRTEMLLYQSYAYAIQKKQEILTILERGAHLRLFLQETKRVGEFKKIEEEIFQVFLKYITVSQSVARTTIHTFFSVCLDEVMRDHSDVSIIDVATSRVLIFTNSGAFQEAYDLATIIFRFIHLQGRFTSQRHVQIGFKLALYLAGRRTKSCENDQKLRNAMLSLSKSILSESLEASKRLKMSVTEISASEVNEIVVLLYEQQNFEDLEHILSQLWSSRIVQKTWSSSTVIWIGRRLVETRFSRGHHAEAIHLCKDIRYNLSRVWGSLDPSTLEFTNLLSELYTATGQFENAAALHESVLTQIAHRDNDEDTSTGITNNNVGPIDIASRQLALHQRALQRRGNVEKSSQAVKELVSELSQAFGNDKQWSEKKVQAIQKSPAKGSPEEQMGMWSPPAHFGIVFDEQQEDKMSKKLSVLKRASSTSWMGWNGSNAGSRASSATYMTSPSVA